MRLALLMVLAGCTAKGEDSGATGPGSDSGSGPPGEPDFALLADQVQGGTFLSAWSAGGEVKIVGGDLGGGTGVLARYDGETLCTEVDWAERALWWLHGTSDDDWYAVGDTGIAIHVSGGTATRIDAPTTATLFGVWADADGATAVGGDVTTGTGEVWRYADGVWTAIATDLPGILFKIWGTHLVGDGVGYQLDGDTLTAIDQPDRLLTLRGRGDDDIWAVGGSSSAVVRHFDGAAWTEVDASGVGQPLNGVWTATGEDVWVGGNFGATARWDGAAWTLPDLPITSEHFHGVWKQGDEVLFVGGDLFSSGGNYGTIGRYGPPMDPLEPTPCP